MSLSYRAEEQLLETCDLYLYSSLPDHPAPPPISRLRTIDDMLYTSGHHLPPTTASASAHSAAAEAVAAPSIRTTRRQPSQAARSRTLATSALSANSAGARSSRKTSSSSVEAPAAPPPMEEGADDDDDEDDEGDEAGEGAAEIDSELSEKRRRNREVRGALPSIRLETDYCGVDLIAPHEAVVVHDVMVHRS